MSSYRNKEKTKGDREKEDCERTDESREGDVTSVIWGHCTAVNVRKP